MSEDRRRMRRQIERERRVRLMRLYIGITVAAILIVIIGSGLLISHLQSNGSGILEALLLDTETEAGSQSADDDSASGYADGEAGADEDGTGTTGNEEGSGAADNADNGTGNEDGNEVNQEEGSGDDDSDGSGNSDEDDETLNASFSYDYEELSMLIEDELEGENVSGTWSVYVKDLTAGQTISINSQSMYAASLIKLYVMMSCYENMDDLITNYCSINHTDALTAESTITDRLYTMIVFSRNESYNELVRLHSSSGSFTSGCRLVNSYIAENGFFTTGVYSTLHPSDSAYETTGEGTNHTTVEDCGALLEAIYNGTCVSEEASEAMLELLLQQDTTTKIPAGIPEGILVANKTGETDEESHDVAIVYGENTDYILCVMSTGVDVMGVGNADTLIKEISALVYDFLN